jgi:hypothetical protein
MVIARRGLARFACACNQVFGLDETRLFDAPSTPPVTSAAIG